MPESKSENYHIRSYRPGDEKAIVSLFNTVFGQSLTIAQWRWKYTGTVIASPLEWLAFDRNGYLQGHVGAIPLYGLRRGQPLPFFQICDVMVHPSARGQLGARNMFTRLMRESLDDIAKCWPGAFTYGFPGRRPFRLGEYIRAYDLVEYASVIHQPVRRRSFSMLYARPLSWYHPQLDILWAQLAPNFDLTLIRDRSFLHWRYATNPFRSYELMGIYLAGRLLGWAILWRNENLLRIIDILIPRIWLKSALAALNRIAMAAGITKVDVWLPHRWRKMIHESQELTDIVVVNLIWHLSIPTVDVREELYYTMGDVDVF